VIDHATMRDGLSASGSSPARNLRVSWKDGNCTTGNILFNLSGTSRDSMLFAHRIQQWGVAYRRKLIIGRRLIRERAPDGPGAIASLTMLESCKDRPQELQQATHKSSELPGRTGPVDPSGEPYASSRREATQHFFTNQHPIKELGAGTA
jgi:hypothetical protein